ncbi:MAG: DUF3618 domain-containing protein [Alphaproteobacteria bacterium]
MIDRPRDTVDTLELEAAANRERLQHTLDELRDRLSPGQLMNDTLTSLQQSNAPSNLRAFADKFGRAARDNPMPVALMGFSAVWLAMSSRNGRHQEEGWSGGEERGVGSRMGLAEPQFSTPGHDDNGRAGDVYDLSEDRIASAETAADSLERQEGESESAFAHRRDRLRARVLRLRERSGESAEELRHRIQEAVQSARASVRRGSVRAGREGRRAYAGASRLFEEQPLLAAAAGVSIGALLAAMLPRTRVEDERLGPQTEAWRREAEERAQRGLREADERAAQAYQAGREQFAGDPTTR